jgi:hypothetical protein
MDKLVKLAGGAVLGFAFLMMLTVIGTLAGYFVGWVVGWFFSETILGILAKLGVHGITTAQFGAFLGFTGGFFRFSPQRPNKD